MSHLRVLLASLLVAGTAPAQMPTQPPPSQEARARQALKEAEKAVVEWQRCHSVEAQFKADYNRKRAELKAAGQAAGPLQEVLNHKIKRLERISALCAAKKQSANEKLQSAGLILDGSEPKSLPWIQPMVNELIALMKRFSQLSSLRPAAGDSN